MVAAVTYYRAVGSIPKKRHYQMRNDEGGLFKEELMGVEGFSSDSSLLYHRYSPSAIVAASEVSDSPERTTLIPNSPLLPRHFLTHQVNAGGDLVQGRRILAGNADVVISYVTADQSSPCYRNATGDELIYIEHGSVELESVFGRLVASSGDYVVVPMSTTHRWVLVSGSVGALVFEARGHIRPPRRYLSDYGQFLEHAPFSERDLRVVEGPLVVEGEDVPVLVRHSKGVTQYTNKHHPFDVVGWDGCLYPYAFSIHDFEPIVKRTHMPPPVHQTFEGPNFVVCSFCPRPFDFDPEAVPVPYYHANVDSDEAIFWVSTDPMSKKYGGIEPGSFTLHPGGFVHGPQPGRTEMAIGKPRTDELFVMMDTFRPLNLGAAGLSVEDEDYAWTWAKGEDAIEAARQS